MKDNLETYKIWAPDNAVWTQWAKPVLFMRPPAHERKELIVPTIDWIPQADYHTMMIADLPGEKGVEEGLAFARLGYRPVPLYNGVYGARASSMIVPVEDIVAALYKGADVLKAYNIQSDAPPVFLLDSNRMKGAGKTPGKYDNRWCVFPQDMPSASFLLKEQIQNIIVYSDEIQNDLSHILRRYQEQGIKIHLYNGRESLKEIAVVKPSHFKSLSYRFQVIMGLVRNASGGFGGKVPEATQSGSGGRRFGMG